MVENKIKVKPKSDMWKNVGKIATFAISLIVIVATGGKGKNKG